MVLGEGENFFIKKQNSNFSAKQFRGDKDNYAAASYCSVKKKEESARFTATFGGMASPAKQTDPSKNKT